MPIKLNTFHSNYIITHPNTILCGAIDLGRRGIYTQV